MNYKYYQNKILESQNLDKRNYFSGSSKRSHKVTKEDEVDPALNHPQKPRSKAYERKDYTLNGVTSKFVKICEAEGKSLITSTS